MPFSAPLDEACIRTATMSLAAILDLPPQISLLDYPAAGALLAESDFRRSWWAGYPDLFRDAIHRSKTKMHRVHGETPALTKAWSSMGAHVQGATWREH